MFWSLVILSIALIQSTAVKCVTVPPNSPTIQTANCNKASDVDKAKDCFAYLFEALGASNLDEFKNKSEAAYSEVYSNILTKTLLNEGVAELDRICQIRSVMNKCYFDDFPATCQGNKLSQHYVYYVTSGFGNPNGIFAFDAVCSGGKLNDYTKSLMLKSNYSQCINDNGGFFLQFNFAYDGYLTEKLVNSKPGVTRSPEENVAFNSICNLYSDRFNVGRVALKREKHNCTAETSRILFFKLTEKLPALILNSCVKEFPYTNASVSLLESSDASFSGKKKFSYFGLGHIQPMNDKSLPKDHFRTCLSFQGAVIQYLYVNYYVTVFGFFNNSLSDAAYIEKMEFRFYGKDMKRIDTLRLGNEPTPDIQKTFLSGQNVIDNANTNGPITIKTINYQKIRLEDEHSGINVVIYKFLSNKRVLYNFELELNEDVTKTSYGMMMYGCLIHKKINGKLSASGEDSVKHDEQILNDPKAKNLLIDLGDDKLSEGNQKMLSMMAMLISVMAELFMQGGTA